MSDDRPVLGTTTATRTRVAVIFGGTSGEHGVSCLTAAAVLAAMNRDRYDVVGVGITPSGRWVRVSEAAIASLRQTNGHLPVLSEDAHDAMLVRGVAGSELAVRDKSALQQLGPVDVALSLLHGPFGEDGTIQGLFEMMGTRYVGAGVLASAVGMDKHFMKLVLAASGLPVGPFVAITPGEWIRDQVACLDACSALHFPVFVKPARGGSSLGITRVERPDKLRAAIEEARGLIRRLSSSRASLALVSWSAGSWSRSTVGVQWPARSPKYGCETSPDSTTTGRSILLPSRWSSTYRLRWSRPSPKKCGHWRCERSKRSAARAWPGWMSS